MHVKYLKVTEGCNLDCDHCFSGGRNKENSKVWNRELIWDIVQKEHCGDINTHYEFLGGEPLLFGPKEVDWMAVRLNGLDNASLGITTNLAYKLTDEHLSLFEKYFSENLATSLDVGYRFKNKTIRKRWESNVRTLVDRGLKIKLNMIVNKELLTHSIADLFHLIDELGFKYFRLERITYDGKAVGLENRILNSEVDDFFHDSFLEYEKGNYGFIFSNYREFKEKFRLKSFAVGENCRDCEQRLTTFNADGTLGGCPNAATKEASSYRAFEEEKISRIAKELTFHEGCLTCDLFSICRGECHRQQWDSSGCPGLKKTMRLFDVKQKLIEVYDG